jgi:hypothetical protein
MIALTVQQSITVIIALGFWVMVVFVIVHELAARAEQKRRQREWFRNDD